MNASKKENLERVRKQTAMYQLARSFAEVEGDKLREIITELAVDIAPCKPGDYVRTPEGNIYKMDAVYLLFENEKPDSYYFQCTGAAVLDDETLGPIETLTGFFKVIERVERPIHVH